MRTLVRRLSPRSGAAAAATAAVCWSVPPLQGQVVLDGSLGPAGQLAGPHVRITADKGRQVGSNLFHSFSTLNVAAKESATFSGPPNVAQVVARVTGGSPSAIHGTLRCEIAGADLYLMNRAGVLFGPNAKIDVQGSFCVTTADLLRLGDGAVFNSLPNAAQDATLTTAAPVAFGFLGTGAPAGVAINKVGAADPRIHEHGRPPEVLTIVGGKIEVAGAATVTPDERGGSEDRPARANFIAVGSAGEVGFDPEDPAALPSGLDDFATLADVEFTDDARIEVGSGRNGPGRAGGILIRGQNLIVRGANLRTRTEAVAGIGIDVNVWDAVSMSGESSLRTSTRDSGAAGPIVIDANRLEMNGGGHVRSDVDLGGSGTGGDVVINVNSMRLTPGGLVPAEILAVSFGSSPGGNVDITSAQPIVLDAADAQLSRIFTEAGSSGRAGDVRIHAAGAEGLSPAAVFSARFDSGTAGSVLLNDVAQVLPPSAVTFDGTVGHGAGPVTRTPNIGAPGGSFVVGADDGAISGAGLFYSFDQLNLNRQEVLRFTGRTGNPTTGPRVQGLRHIIARVTGGEQSVIDGRMVSEVNGAALYVLNPAGVIVGPFGRIDVPGSIVLTSASAVRLGEAGGTFGVGPAFAGSPGSAVPSGLAFDVGAGPVTVLGLPLTSSDPDKRVTQIDAGVNGVFTLAGGPVTVQSRTLVANGDLAVAGNEGAGRINLLSVASAGTVSFDPTSSIGQFDIDAPQLGPVRMHDGGNVDVSGVFFDSGDPQPDTPGGRGGRVDVRGSTFEMSQGSSIRADSTGPDANVTGLGIDVRTSGSVTIDESVIVARAPDGGNGGNIDIQAGGDLTIVGNGGNPARVFSTFGFGLLAENKGPGRGGSVRIVADRVVLADGAKVQAITNGTGPAGNIDVSAEDVLIDNGLSTEFTLVSTQSGQPTSGDAGNVTFGADGRLRTLELRSGASIVARTLSRGHGGTIVIQARDAVLLDGTTSPVVGENAFLTSIDASSFAFVHESEGTDHGAAGRIDLRAGELIMRGFAELKAATQTSGAGGSIKIVADSIDLAGDRPLMLSPFRSLSPSIRVQAGRNDNNANLSEELAGTPTGSGGPVDIQAGRMTLRDGATVETSTSNEGNAGPITVRVNGKLLIEGFSQSSKLSGLESRTSRSESQPDDDPGVQGDAGRIFVKAGTLELRDRGRINNESKSETGAAGDIEIHVGGSIRMTDGAIISSKSEFLDAGRLEVTAGEQIEMRDDRGDRPPDGTRPTDRTQITLEAFNGNGGAVKVSAPVRILLHNAEVTTKARGAGGDILMDTFVLVMEKAAVIADAQLANAGNIDIRANLVGFDPSLPDDTQGDNTISADSERGLSDSELVSPTDSDVVAQLVRLPDAFPGVDVRLPDLCGATVEGTSSSFVVTGHGGGPSRPGGLTAYLPLLLEPTGGEGK